MKGVFIVDNHSELADMIQECVELDLAIQVIGKANSGERALKDLETITADVIIADVVMPNMDGFTFIEKLQESRSAKAIPRIIMLSAFENEGSKERARELGVEHFIAKPFDVQELISHIKC